MCVDLQEEAPFVLVRMRVVKLLGRLGGRINRNLVTGSQTQRESPSGRSGWSGGSLLMFSWSHQRK